MRKIKYLSIPFIIAAAVGLCSCGFNIKVKAIDGQHCVTTTYINLGQAITELVYSMAGADVQEAGDNFPVVVEEGEFKMTQNSPSEFEIESPYDPVADEGYIKLGKNTLSVIIGPDNIHDFYENGNEEMSAYMDLLMIPSLTDEKMTSAEYRELIASVYGEEMAKELDNAKVNIILEAPDKKTVKKAEYSDDAKITKAGAKASVEIPLAQILVIEENKTFTIWW